MTDKPKPKSGTPPQQGHLPETVNPRYKGAAMPDLARLVTPQQKTIRVT